MNDIEQQALDRRFYGFSVTGPDGERIDPTKVKADSGLRQVYDDLYPVPRSSANDESYGMGC